MTNESQPPLPLPDSLDLAAMTPLCSIFRRYLKSQNLKYTPERADILNAIIERDEIFEADELMRALQLQGHRVSKATIYRTIKLLQDAGIITGALFDSKQEHYQLIYGRSPIDTMVCIKTGKTRQFNAPELNALRDRLCEESGWSAVGHRFQIYGISPEAKDAASD